MTGLMKTMTNVSISKTNKDGKGRILIVEVTIEEVPFIMVNLYNAYTEVEELKILSELDLLFDDFLLDDSKNIVIAGDLNLLFDSNLDASGGSPTLKKSQFQRSYNLQGNII